ncbi:hypothetical protein EHF33_12155 [Deinococcus psychrotolerans]|uniref:Uncharacterized protein n=1 Tax=Deinococcus psychrotolerans TaxID=2489213 RepID=A0A3G8YEK5_9DEIO|nr:hypothetical protein [Deinococcus psychrotolerans]AZI43405.1 hypothetical protein EHF33_12155 [Deinococcus psychrotolerans]
MTQHGKYGDAPLGKSDEELREEGADALTNSERRRNAEMGSDESVPVLIPIAGTSSPAVVAADAVLPDAEERREES